MLVLTSKKYEIEETIMVENEEKEVLYEFQMQITPDEMKEIRDLLFDEKTISLGKKLSKEKDVEKANQIEEEMTKRALFIQEKFETVCFKEHKEEFKNKCGEYKYLEMVDMIYGFFMNAFIEKRAKQINTINTNLKKIG